MHNSVLYANCSLTEAYQLPMSEIDDFFTYPVFQNWKKSKEIESTIQVAIVDRLNRVIQAIGHFMKMIAKRRR